ncbi:alpha/beta-hydrolase [Clavulina sp. PMI_390]|nr:alpha/beta-hydrolase [Clavulina sp. PMI_390]
MVAAWSFLLLSLSSLANVATARSPTNPKALRNEILDSRGPQRAPAASTPPLEAKRSALATPRSTISFSNPAAAAFHVNGTSLPDVDFDVGDSWSGLMPISSNANETRKLFFWFWPSKDPKYTDDLVFWTNGGPGCSSLEGLLQENGPFKWPPGTAKPIQNQWGWSNLSHVLYVEQPVGTGFSQGVPNIHDDDELAAQIAGFMVQFLNVFSELKGKKLYVTGESYAGFYVPYIANYLYEHPGLVPLNMTGVWITDPSVSWDIVTEYIPAVSFAQKWQSVLGFTDSFMAKLESQAQTCGFANYTEKYATYPPKGKLPLPSQAYRGIPNYANITSKCTTWDDILNEALNVNPNFNMYRILDVWPVLWDVLGFPGSFDNVQSPLYFNRTEVQDAIHAPHISWSECSNINVYVDGVDNSVPSMLSVMPNVIEKSARTVVMHGLVDYVLIAEGTRIAIQNMTWGGAQGFQTPIAQDSFVIESFGSLGNMHQERVTYVEVNLSGHMMPQYAPWAAYKTLWYLLGRGELTSTAIDNSLYPNDFQLYGTWDHKSASSKPARIGKHVDL